jgi:hypothetical protein
MTFRKLLSDSKLPSAFNLLRRHQESTPCKFWLDVYTDNVSWILSTTEFIIITPSVHKKRWCLELVFSQTLEKNHQHSFKII